MSMGTNDAVLGLANEQYIRESLHRGVVERYQKLGASFSWILSGKIERDMNDPSWVLLRSSLTFDGAEHSVVFREKNQVVHIIFDGEDIGQRGRQGNFRSSVLTDRIEGVV
jgi:hypothetical protein